MLCCHSFGWLVVHLLILTSFGIWWVQRYMAVCARRVGQASRTSAVRTLTSTRRWSRETLCGATQVPPHPFPRDKIRREQDGYRDAGTHFAPVPFDQWNILLTTRNWHHPGIFFAFSLLWFIFILFFILSASIYYDYFSVARWYLSWFFICFNWNVNDCWRYLSAAYFLSCLFCLK